MPRTGDGPAPGRHGIMSDAHEWFRAGLGKSWVPAYLAGRGFPAGAQRRWGIGYAPARPDALTEHLRMLGYGDDEIVASGLARRGQAVRGQAVRGQARREQASQGRASQGQASQGQVGRLRDTFRGRAMFAIRTADGAIAGFIGRRRDDAPGPKYLNGPDTSLFHKGELLYGLHEARDRLAVGACPVLVEGPLDAIAVTIAGPAEYAAVATCGLALTTSQLAALGDVADLDETGVVLALDGDQAGRSGAVRTWERLAGIGGPLGTACLPAGHDPAGLLHSGGRTTVLEALRKRRPLMDEVVDAAVSRAGGALATPEERVTALRAASRVIAARPPESARQVVRLAARLDVPASLVTEVLVDTVSP
ncbi:hypothetical protein E1281_17680 [Actinomadura sp. KC345]|uniref:toprim domain-containing protein n=1 Tax=Actinomadura sp. KC345 TaxID=2530371 RepID=UPI001052906D|nr:toprim domain-containing protein [Actinomadura sp. KC345]TDC53489.1 hypothetical protein E1281_17680 [Actinomadura sp. KC345]